MNAVVVPAFVLRQPLRNRSKLCRSPHRPRTGQTHRHTHTRSEGTQKRELRDLILIHRQNCSRDRLRAAHRRHPDRQAPSASPATPLRQDGGRGTDPSILRTTRPTPPPTAAATASSTAHCTSSPSNAPDRPNYPAPTCNARKLRARTALRRCAASSVTSHAATIGCSYVH